MLAIIGSAIIFFVALIHIYWGFGGKFWADKAVPTMDDGTPLFARMDTLVYSPLCLFLSVCSALTILK